MSKRAPFHLPPAPRKRQASAISTATSHSNTQTNNKKKKEKKFTQHTVQLAPSASPSQTPSPNCTSEIPNDNLNKSPSHAPQPVRPTMVSKSGPQTQNFVTSLPSPQSGREPSHTSTISKLALTPLAPGTLADSFPIFRTGDVAIKCDLVSQPAQ
ncbi:hypothetical protein P153DRAFT_357663 [Dothidotthia symphoricarpi CBS 119687]|uniref:Uncharacterized protein n=1 Tax=Dothidotthia symphoricarpi CBS 119687 TaxID=1392245 RepID=A0A6A6A901_9PLEO|nr:uncharacterized protein P153DRAFT_357663 [Dothidotthia symphoricarpi CBS 119687]KAF2128290.1 hypothetical protein P153DRAFT_357663 [Dothidotthia symphoricarpi CBS 119687]